MRHDRGVTLLEATIVLSLMVALMVLVTMFFVRGQRYTIATETYAAVQRQATQVLGRMTEEMYRGSRRQLVVGTDNKDVGFLSFAPVEGSGPDEPLVEFEPNTGRLVWKKWVAFAFDSSRQEVRRVEIPLISEVTELATPANPPGDVALFRSSPESRLLSRDVSRFEVYQSAGGVSVSLTVSRLMPVSALSDEQKDVFVNVKMEVNLVN